MLALPMLSVGTFTRDTVLPLVKLFNRLVVELQTGFVFVGTNFNTYR